MGFSNVLQRFLQDKMNLKAKSRGSSSSSGSMKLITQIDLERKTHYRSVQKDLFDLLIDENHSHSLSQSRTIEELNLSPRGNVQGCKCTKIDCLKMYCQCFSKGKHCNERCQCINCCNHISCQVQIYKAQQMANYRHPGTFKEVPAWAPIRRCTCKKSQCKKNYCDCYRAGMKCTEECECLDCQNGKPPQDPYFDSRMQIEVHA